MTVLCHGVRGGRSSPHVKEGSMTEASGAYAALSRVSNERSLASSPIWYPKFASSHRTVRPIDLA
jgi:hypothetical protein